MGWGNDYGWDPYVPVAQRRAEATATAIELARQAGRKPSPVKPEGRAITKTFWGNAWCKNLKSYSDYSNRLPRGATYLRNGSVVDLVIRPGVVEAIVAGSEPYQIEIAITQLSKEDWQQIKQDCSASIDSLLDLLAGKFSKGVMERLTRQKGGLFPAPKQISMSCSCPDSSRCCKHLAAVMYGIGCRLDTQPELLFLLRNVDHTELVSEAIADGNLNRELADNNDASLAGVDLGELFGIELEQPIEAAAPPKRRRTATATKPKPAVATKKKATGKDSLKRVAGETAVADAMTPPRKKGSTKPGARPPKRTVAKNAK